MSERRVSVRLVGVGGDQLKTLLSDVGDKGQAAMASLTKAAGPASASMQEVDRAAQAAGVEMKGLYERTALANAVMRSAAVGADNLADRMRAAGMAGRTFRTSADEADAYGRVLDNLRAKHNPLYAVIRQYKGTVAELRQAHAAGALSVDEMTAAIQRERQAALASIDALKGRNRTVDQMAGGVQNAAYRMQNLSFQVQDIGVSLAGGMNPFTVMAQQGSQIAQIYGFGGGGVNALMRDLGGMFSLLGRSILGVVTRFPLVTAAVAVLSGGIFGLQREINQTSAVTVTFGDTALAVLQTIGEGVKIVSSAIWDFIKPAVDMISEWFWAAWDGVAAGVRWVGNILINGTKVAVDGIRTAIDTVPDLFRAAFSMAAAHVLTKMHDMIWYVGQAVNSVAAGLNEVFGTNLSTDNFASTITALSDASGVAFNAGVEAQNRAAGAWSDFSGRASETMNSDPMGALFDYISGRAQQNAQNRLAGEEEEGGGGGRGAADEVAEAAEEAARGWAAVAESLNKYATEAQNWGTQIGDALVGAFTKAEDAFVSFVTTGKVDFKSLATSIIGDLARIAARKYILGPIASMLGGFTAGLGSGPEILPSFDGGGHTGYGARAGGLDGQGGFLAMLHPRERVYDETRNQGGGPVYVTIQTQDVNSFRRSKAQIGADIQRAVSRGRRVM
jgi:hypothetical protein